MYISFKLNLFLPYLKFQYAKTPVFFWYYDIQT